YQRNREHLADSRLSDVDMKKLYIMDSTTITLFKDILKGVGRNPLQGKKKGGIKAHTIVKASENVPCLIRYSAAVRHDHTFLNEVHTLSKGSIITFDKGYVDYAQYEAFSQSGIFYVTRLKENAVYQARKEYDLPETAPSSVLKDEEVVLYYGQDKKSEHRRSEEHTSELQSRENLVCRPAISSIFPYTTLFRSDKGYVDYAQYEAFSQSGIFYVTRLKENAVYQARKEYDLPETAPSSVLKDEEVVLYYGQDKKSEHRTRRIAYWDDENKRLFEFISNNFEFSAEKIALIYKQRWKIELLFKQLKQNFPLKYFLGDNENAIEIQIWAAMLANLLITLVKSKVKRSWAFSNMVSLIRNQLMNYVDIYRFLEDPEGCWRKV